MFHNLHSQFHVLKMALLHFPHTHFSFLGKVHAPSPAGLLLLPPNLIILRDEQSGHGISGVYNLVFIGTCSRALGQTLTLPLPAALWIGRRAGQLEKRSNSSSPVDTERLGE